MRMTLYSLVSLEFYNNDNFFLFQVHQGGAKNAVKRMTVSYTDVDSAMRAIEAYANDKDVRGIDFVAECLEFQDKRSVDA